MEMDRVLKVVGIAVSTAAVLMLVAYIGLALFAAEPTGQYHIDTQRRGCSHEEPVLVASVYQDMFWAPDREIYRGPPAMAWQLYFNLTTPATNFRTADLIWEEANLQWQLQSGQ